MLHRATLAVTILSILTACAPNSSGSPVLLRVYATSAASPWLRTAYACAPENSAIELGPEGEVDLVLRLTEPRLLVASAFQVGTDELLVVTHPEVAVGQLSVEQVEALFTGQITNWREVGGEDLSVEVWTYSPAVDVQVFFDRMILHDRPVSSLARLAVSTQDMSDSVGSNRGSVGILPRRWKAGNTHEALIVAPVPVLALTSQPPQGPLADLVACMQGEP